MPSAEFQAAADATKKFTVKPSDGDLLKLYALFKVANGDTPTKPGMLDFTGKAKYSAWEKEKDKSPEDAEKEYIALVEEFKTTYKYDENKVPEVTK